MLAFFLPGGKRKLPSAATRKCDPSCEVSNRLRFPPLQSAIAQEIRRASTAEGSLLDALLHHQSREVLGALLENPRLGERELSILLSRRDLSRELVARIAENRAWMKSHPLKLAVVKHPKTPRHLALPLLKHFYLFDLLAVAASPGVPAELRRQAEELIQMQRDGLALGQRLSLARQGSHRIAAGLLGDPNRRVVEAALSNPAMTEHAIVQALFDRKPSPELASVMVDDERWFARYSVKLALLRGSHLSLGRVMAILPELARNDLSDLAEDPRVRAEIRAYVARLLRSRHPRGEKKLHARDES
jgi:hypothetical protein